MFPGAAGSPGELMLLEAALNQTEDGGQAPQLPHLCRDAVRGYPRLPRGEGQLPRLAVSDNTPFPAS